MPPPRDRSLNRALHYVLNGLAESSTPGFELDDGDHQALDDDAVAALIRTGILRPIEGASTVVCPGCEEACLMLVENRASASGYQSIVVCDKPQNLGRIEIDQRSLERWQMGFDSVVACLSAIVPLASDPTMIVADRLARLGRADISGSEVELFVLRGAAADLLGDPAIRRAPRAAILYLGPPPDATLAALDLTEALDFKGGRLRFRSDRLAQALSSAPVGPEGNAFLIRGADCILRFKGKEVTVRHSSGMAYIAMLLATPRTPVRAVELYAHVRTGGRWLEQRGLEASDGMSRAELRRALETLESETSAARAAGANAKVQRLERQRAELERQLAHDFGRHGRARRQSDPAEKARQNVHKAIRAALTNIGRGHPALHGHLDRSIETGHECVYRPSESVRWQTNR